MEAKHIATGPDGRRIISGETGPARVLLPMQVVDGICSEAELAVLLRFTEASELSKGNIAVAVINGEPHGRFAHFSDRVDFQTYQDAEIGAYRWILRCGFGKQAAMLAEIVARLNGERIKGFDLIEFGQELGNTLNKDVALGAAIGSVRALAWMLQDAYRDYGHYWKAQQAARAAGRALTDEQGVQRQRRADLTRRVIQGYANTVEAEAVGDAAAGPSSSAGGSGRDSR